MLFLTYLFIYPLLPAFVWHVPVSMLQVNTGCLLHWLVTLAFETGPHTGCVLDSLGGLESTQDLPASAPLELGLGTHTTSLGFYVGAGSKLRPADSSLEATHFL